MAGRRWKALLMIACVLLEGQATLAADEAPFRIALFSADVTPPLGHPLLGGTTTPPPAHAIDDPLFAKGLVLLGGAQPVVLVSIDWCEIRNDAFDRWREVLAASAGTRRECVLVTAIHQHDAPLADLEAQRILNRSPLGGAIVDFEYHEHCVQRTAEALRAGLQRARRVTHFGTSQAKVERVASNRRYLDLHGRPRFDRSSMSGGDREKAEAPEEEIDPFLKTLSFWDGDVPVCGLHVYAVHPMGHWGSGRVTADFPGLARRRLQEENESVFQIYASGCAGDTTAGKYNDASELATRGLQDRLYQAMVTSWKSANPQPLTKIDFRHVPLQLPLRSSAGYTQADLEQQLESENPKKRRLAALGLSWRKRHQAGQPIDLPVVDFGSAVIALLPGETYVRFQLEAQKMRPDDFVLVLGYGESAPGFVPMESAWEEQDTNLSSWCWVNPGSERPLIEALKRALEPATPPRFIRQWGGNGEAEGQFKSPIGIAIDQRDVIYVSEFHGSRVQKFDVDGKFIGQFPILKHAGGIAVHPQDGRIFVAAMTLHKIAAHDSDGKPLLEFGEKGEGDGQFNEPGGLMFGPDGALYVVDQANHRIQVFSSEGKFLRKFGSYGTEPGQFGGLGKQGSRLSGPHFLIFDDRGDIFTTEGAQGRIQKLTAEGKPILAWGKNDEGPGGFGGREKAARNALPGPIGLALDLRGHLWVSSSNSRLQCFTTEGGYRTGRLVEGDEPGQSLIPHALALDSQGFLYVVDSSNHRIQKFEP